MNSDNQQGFFCKDGEHRIYCHICDKLCTDRFYKNHLKSKTQTNNIRKKEQLNKSFQVISQF